MFINLIQASITKSYHFSWLKTKIDFHNQPVATFKDAYTLINEVYKARVIIQHNIRMNYLHKK
jgi:hypothetical protein